MESLEYEDYAYIANPWTHAESWLQVGLIYNQGVGILYYTKYVE